MKGTCLTNVRTRHIYRGKRVINTQTNSVFNDITACKLPLQDL